MAMIGLKIPPKISEQLSKISVPGKKSSAEELHITMFYFKDKLKIDDVLSIVQNLYTITKKSDELQIKATTISSFKKNDDGIPIIVPVISEDLLALRKKIAKKFDDAGIEYSKKWPEYKPHITLSFSSKEMEDKKLDKTISWKAGEIVLWAGGWHTDPGILVELPLQMNKRASKFEPNIITAQLFESLTRLS